MVSHLLSTLFQKILDFQIALGYCFTSAKVRKGEILFLLFLSEF